MFSPTRTALYLAIGGMAFAANEASAVTLPPSCVYVGGVKTCWKTGSEVCDVTAYTDPAFNPFNSVDFVVPTPSFVECSVTGSSTTVDGAEGGGGLGVAAASFLSCPTSGTLPTGTLTCGTPPSDFAIAAVAAPTIVGDDYYLDQCKIFGTDGVKVSGGSTDGPTDFASNDVCSTGSIEVSGNKTKVYGGAYAGTNVKVSGGAYVAGTHPNAVLQNLVPVADAPCEPYSTLGTLGEGVSYKGGDLKVSKGATLELAPDAYCFKSVNLSGGSILAISGATTINVAGTFESSGGSTVFNTTSFANLTINGSTQTKKVKLSGGSGAKVSVFAPDADIKIAGGANFSGSFIGKTVEVSGGSTINNDAPAVIIGYDIFGDPIFDTLFAVAPFTCNPNTGVCTATAEVGPIAGNTCGNGALALDFTADAFIGTVQLCDGDPTEEGSCYVVGQQLCQLSNGQYVCNPCGGGS